MVEHLTIDSFKEKIFDFEKSENWKYEGTLPSIIDFYADWCGPCKMVGPIIEELAKEYEGRVNFYKINTDEEQELAGMFGVQSIPSLLFIPANDRPQMSVGALPKAQMVKAINDVLNVPATA